MPVVLFITLDRQQTATNIRTGLPSPRGRGAASVESGWQVQDDAYHHVKIAVQQDIEYTR